MADTEAISQLPSVTTANLSSVVAGVQASTTVKISLQQILDAFNADQFTVSNNIVAFASGGQTNATILSATSHRIATVASSGDSVKITTSPIIGQPIYIRNDGANACDLFPPVSGQINALGINTAISIAAGDQLTIVPFSSTQFYTMT